MLGPVFDSGASHEDEAEESILSDPLSFQTIPKLGPERPLLNLRHLLIRCAELVSASDTQAAGRLVSFLSSATSPFADSSTHRLAHHFSVALSHRLAAAAAGPCVCDAALLQSSYLSLNQITPFIRFGHLTANQAILEAFHGHRALHIIDFDIMYGLQWPPFMQAIAALHPPPTLRITATTDHDLPLLRRTGDRLQRFAHSLGLTFRFNPLLFPAPAAAAAAFGAHLHPGEDEEEEALAVNCVFYLHKLLLESDDVVRMFLQSIKALKPKVVTVAEREADHNHPHFLRRFVEALDHFAAIFDSLEATVPPNNPDRLAVERVWLGREIMEMVGMRREQQPRRHQRYRAWEVALRGLGFRNVPLSPFALSQAKLLLRLHYPSPGYQLHFQNDSFFLLGWQNQALFSVSSWR